MSSAAFREDERLQYHGKRFVLSLVGIVSKPPEILQQNVGSSGKWCRKIVDAADAARMWQQETEEGFQKDCKALVVIIGGWATQPTLLAFAIELYLYELVACELRPILVILILYHLPQPTPDQLLGLEMAKEQIPRGEIHQTADDQQGSRIAVHHI